MKTINLLQTVIGLLQTVIGILILFSLNSCAPTMEESFVNINSFKISPYNNNKTIVYSENYLLDDSSSNVDIGNDVINLEIPIPYADYNLLNTYNISTGNNAAILFLIGRDDTISVVDMPVNYVIQASISISDLNLDNDLLDNGNGLRIFVMNNANELESDSDVINCLVDRVDQVDINANKCDYNSKAADGPRIYNGSIIMM
ncbi:MAG: hypothetical protein V3U80_08970 [Flavobacteriaceae bacterium]